jgi:SAM-dependent methyltransferase
MIQQTRRLGLERQLTNLRLSQNAAEALPIASNSLDLVTCRVAGHHFANFAQALDEVRRVLKPGGALVMADSVAPEDDAVAQWMNHIELRRDFSHVKNRQVSEIEAILSARGLTIDEREYARIYLQFNDWVARTATPPDEVEALRKDFLSAPSSVREAFQIGSASGDIHFSWPCLVFRAVKG